VRFSPDKKLLIFRTNMFGATYVLGVEVAKAAAGAKDIASTPALNKQFQVALPARPTR
jgi:oligogalacturonide lyase